MFFITDAHAQAQAAGPMGALGQFLPLIAIFAMMYFLMIRPQMKRAKELKAMIAALKKGDEVVTGGGLMGKITQIDENFVSLEVSRVGAQPVEMVFQRGAIQSVLPHGTIKL